MVKRIYLVPEEMRRTSQNIDTFGNEYLQISNQIQGISDALSSQWVGEDSVTYQQNLEEFTTQLKKMSQKLKAASQTLDQQRRLYEQRRDINRDYAGKLAR